MKIAVLAGSLVAAVASSVSAQVIYNTAGTPYTQNFDGLSPTFTGTTAVAFTNNSSTTNTRGWYMGQSGTGAVSGTRDNANNSINIIEGTGSSNTGRGYNFGSTGSSDRALGVLSSSAVGDAVISFVIRNNTGAQIDNVAISYWGEQWRSGGNPLSNSFVVDYLLTSSFTTTTLLGNAASGGWTGVSALNFTSPITGGSAAALDGNATANRTQQSATLSNIAWQDQDYLVIRFWYDRQASGSSQGIAIDDFSLNGTVVPTPGAIGLAGLGLLAAARRRRA
jgi:MYXO-CTERM domain-containing protein